MAMNTTELLHKLSAAKDIKRFLCEYEQEFRAITCTDFINDVLNERKIAPAVVAKKSGQGEYVYKVIRGERKPSRDILIAIAVGMELTLDETQFLLRISKWAVLDPKDKRDSIIMYSIGKKHEIHQLNELLYDMQQPTL